MFFSHAIRPLFTQRNMNLIKKFKWSNYSMAEPYWSLPRNKRDIRSGRTQIEGELTLVH